MNVLSNTAASSDDDEIVVCKRKTNQAGSRRNRLADSDDDLPPQSPLLAPTGTSDKDSSLRRLNSRTADSMEHSKADEDDDASTPSNTDTEIGMSDDKDVENKLRKGRVVRDILVSDDETEAPTLFEKTFSSKKFKEGMKKIVDSDSESDDNKQIKPSRFRRKDKVMEQIRKTFGKKRTENNIETNDIMKPLSALCDKDSSTSVSEDEQSQALNESIHNIKHSYEKHKDVSKSKVNQKNKLKIIEPHHKRMSAKEAMENMTKIKSESNRMLRERRVMLPYHRPRQLSLQDILGRKRPVLGDANHLSFKMNQEQLEQYALQLEESQKHMTELYKSDDEDDHLAEKEIDNNTMANNETDRTFNEIDQDNGGTTENVNIMQNNCDSAKEISEKQLETANTSESPVTDVRSMEIYQEASPPSMNNSADNYNSNKTMEEESDCLPAITIGADSPPKLVDSVPSEHNMNQDSQLIHLHFDSENTEVDEQPNAEKDNRVNMCGRYSENRQDVNKNNKASSADVREAHNSNSEIDNIGVNKVSIALTDSNVEKANSDYKTHDTVQKTTPGNKSADSNELDTSFDKDKDWTNEEMSLRINTSEFSSLDEKDKSKEIAMEMMQDDSFDDDFPDDDIDAIMDKIDNGKVLEIDDSPMLMMDVKRCKPQLSGTPGTVIDLDDPTPAQKKMSGVDLLKQRYVYFSNMRTPEEEERENEKKMKPGAKHLQLKQELERQIAEQSLAEWTKRLEEDRQQQERANGELSDCEDELEKMEKTCDDIGNDQIKEDSIAEEASENKDKEQGDELGEEEEEEELDENEEGHKRKMKPNPMIDDEAEVDDDEEGDDDEDVNDDNDANEDAAETDNQSGSTDEQESSSEEEDTEGRKPKKGRIIKAFEDSDDEDQQVENKIEIRSEETMEKCQVIAINTLLKQTSDLFESQTTEADEDIPLAQTTQSNTEDMNMSFIEEIKLVPPTTSKAQPVSEKLTVIFETQNNSELDMEAIVGMCSGKFPSESQPEPPVSASVARLVGDLSTQLIGEDILQLCSGRFGEDVLTTQTVNNDNIADMLNTQSLRLNGSEPSVPDIEMNRAHRLFDDEDLDTNIPKINKFFGEHINGHRQEPHDDRVDKDRKLQKGKLVIESSDEETEVRDGEKNKKKMKRKKREKRTLLISDDEEEESEREQSFSEDDGIGEEGDKIFEYDSEENEVEVKRAGMARARATHDFFEREAELSSEEEWAGSGDEDERGPDRLEREAGDDDVFHQGRLRRELGQMHMQDLLDQDKREVRMLQEILLEDGDLAGGSRQRKFRWKNTEGGEEAGTVPDEFGDTPEDERESEEQWRRQRHERQVFLRQLAEQQKASDDILDVGFARSIVASSLRCKTTSSVETAEEEGKTTAGVVEKKQSNKDLPSPVKNSFTIMQEQYRALVNGVGGGGSLRRLAALVEPGEKPIHNVSSLAPGKKRSFVFTTLTQPASEPLEDDDDPPATQKKKRKAEMDVGTPKLIKKLRVEEKHNRRSIFHHLDT